MLKNLFDARRQENTPCCLTRKVFKVFAIDYFGYKFVLSTKIKQKKCKS